MVMYKQNQGLMAKGTVGTQTTGGTTMPRKLMSTGQAEDFSGQNWGGKIPGMPEDWLGKAGYDIANMFTGGQYGKDRALEAARARAAQESPASPVGAMSQQQALGPTPRSQQTALSQSQIMDLINNGYIYTARGMSNEGLARAYDKMASDRRAAMQTTGAMSQQPSGVSYGQSSVLGANYRPPAQSAWANFENPFTLERQRLLEAQAIQQAEEQAAVTAGRLGSQLAGAGLMSGGGTGLSQSMAQQLAMQTEGQRLQALRDIALQVPMQRADFEARRAAGLDAWAPTAFGISERIAKLPGELSQQEAANRLTTAQADIARLEANIQADPRIIEANKAKIIAQTGLTEAEYEAAMRIIATTDPSLWYNHPAWGIAGGVIDNALKISQAFKNFSTAGK